MKLNHAQITAAEACYTGGGVYLFTGSLSDGTHFLTGNDDESVLILDAYPNLATDDEGENPCFEEWQRRHLVREEIDGYSDMIAAILSHILSEGKPGNYDPADLVRILESLNR